jgi:hypothetical protein
MLGMPAVRPPSADSQPAAAPASPAPAAPPSTGPAASAPAPTPVAPATRAPAANTKRTMMGVAGLGSLPAAGAASAPAPTAASAPTAAPAPAAGAAPADAPAPAARPSPAEAPAAPSHFTPAAAPPAAFEEDDDDWDAPRPRPGRSRSWMGLVLGGAALGLLGLGLMAYLFLTAGPDVRVAVVHTDQGEALQVDVPGAPDGTLVRFAGQQRELSAGRAHFPLDGGALSIGDNDVALDVTHPGGRTREATIRLTVDYRVRAELDRLDDDPPAFTIHVHARPGSKVTLDGEALPLNAKGTGRRRIAVDDAGAVPGPDDLFEHRVRYRIAPPDGDASEGSLRTRIPYATLQIDRPGREVITDRESVEVAGAAHATARVHVDGKRVAIEGGRFLVEHPLPEPGDYEVAVVASKPGRIARRETLRITRVASLQDAAKNFRADPGLGYARIAQNPSIYRGRKVEMIGRIYNVEVGGGQSVLQMLVQDCPQGERCPLWVSYGAATDLTVQTWARVLGEVAGEQQFRSETGRVITVPRVHAKLVLPVAR